MGQYSRMDQLKFKKFQTLSQILLGPFLNTLPQMLQLMRKKKSKLAKLQTPNINAPYFSRKHFSTKQLRFFQGKYYPKNCELWVYLVLYIFYSFNFQIKLIIATNQHLRQSSDSFTIKPTVAPFKIFK